MSVGDCLCEYARTGQAKCKQCKEKLEKGEFRVGIYVVNPFDPDGDAVNTAWYHPRCFFVHRFKNGHPTDTSAFAGFKDLEKADQKELAELVKGGHIAKGKAAPKKAAAASSKKKKADAGSRSPSPAPKKKTAGTKRKAKAAAAEESEEEEEEEEDEEEDEKPAKKAKASTKKASPAAASKGGAVFAGLTFCLSGAFSVKKAALETSIIQAGGKVAGSVTKAVTHVASNEWHLQNDKCVNAQNAGKECVTEAWVNKAISTGKLPPDA